MQCATAQIELIGPLSPEQWIGRYTMNVCNAMHCITDACMHYDTRVEVAYMGFILGLCVDEI